MGKALQQAHQHKQQVKKEKKKKKKETFMEQVHEDQNASNNSDIDDVTPSSSSIPVNNFESAFNDLD